MASIGKVSANYRDNDYEALLWMAEAWSDEPLPDLGVAANPADEPERARSEAEDRMREIRKEASNARFCGNCGREVEEGSARPWHCRYCGPLDEDETHVETITR